MWLPIQEAVNGDWKGHMREACGNVFLFHFHSEHSKIKVIFMREMSVMSFKFQSPRQLNFCPVVMILIRLKLWTRIYATLFCEASNKKQRFPSWKKCQDLVSAFRLPDKWWVFNCTQLHSSGGSCGIVIRKINMLGNRFGIMIFIGKRSVFMGFFLCIRLK